jgi:hypothetical protein
LNRVKTRNHFLDALRTCLGELLQLDDPEGKGMEEVAAALQRRVRGWKIITRESVLRGGGMPCLSSSNK